MTDNVISPRFEHKGKTKNQDGAESGVGDTHMSEGITTPVET